jgi:hypothetical protein
MLTGLLTALLLVAAPIACRKPAQPSEEFSQARTRFGKLYAEKGDGAFVDPEIEQIEATLARVPPDSLDAAAARDLRARIQAGRQEAQTRAKAQEDALAKARTPGEMPSGFKPLPLPKPAPPEEPVDAGPPAPAMPQVGTLASELASGFSGCFRKGDPLEVTGRGLRDRWELQDRAACRQQYGALQEQVLIIEEGKVIALAPKSAIKELPADGR